jgi:hypothetical protein
MCTICYLCALYMLKSEESPEHQCVYVHIRVPVWCLSYAKELFVLKVTFSQIC